MDVSIVIVNWNTRDVLRNCLCSLHTDHRDLLFEIIVVDNASKDGSAEMVRSEFPAVRIVANDRNLGFAAANNQGMRLGAGRYYLLLNPDTIVLEDAILKVAQYADVHKGVAVVGCQVLEADHRIQKTGFSFPTPLNLFLIYSGLSRIFPRSRVFGRPEIGWWERTTERDVDVISGMFMLVRREAASQVGLMDEAYFVYAEEADWCYRFWKAGWRCVFAPVGQIIHLDGGGKSTSQVSVKMFVQLQKSLMIFQKKNLGWISWLIAKVIYTVSNSVRAVLWAIFWMLKGDRRERDRAWLHVPRYDFICLGLSRDDKRH